MDDWFKNPRHPTKAEIRAVMSFYNDGEDDEDAELIDLSDMWPVGKQIIMVTSLDHDDYVRIGTVTNTYSKDTYVGRITLSNVLEQKDGRVRSYNRTTFMWNFPPYGHRNLFIVELTPDAYTEHLMKLEEDEKKTTAMLSLKRTKVHTLSKKIASYLGGKTRKRHYKF